MNNQIIIAGSIIADVVKNIDIYPKVGMMAYVSEISPAVGGCVPNTAIDLTKIDSSIPVATMGCVGNDENGRYIIRKLKENNVNVEKIIIMDSCPTSFCDVMSLPNGDRTFFHKKGANAEFSPGNIDVNSLECEIFHIGYILLLDKFDEGDDEYGTVMAKFLKSVQEKGIKTSIDVVSDSTADYGEKIIPALKYCNYVVINEIECCRIWGLDAYTDGQLNYEDVKLSMTKMIEAGVKDKVVIHSKKVSFALDAETMEFTIVPSLDIPKEEIKGSVGAGDAFCAGCLYGLYNGFSSQKLLEFASATAACSLFAANSIDGMKTKQEIFAMMRKYRRVSL